MSLSVDATPQAAEASKDWSKCHCCGLKHDPAPDRLPPLSSNSVIGDEFGEVLWLPGHIGNRDHRRRLLSQSEWCFELNFMGTVKAARSASYVWMFQSPMLYADDLWRECHGWRNTSEFPLSVDERQLLNTDQVLFCDHEDDKAPCLPWTRIEVSLGWEYER